VRVLIGAWRISFHSSRRNNNGINAFRNVIDALDTEEVSKRVALRLFMAVDDDDDICLWDRILRVCNIRQFFLIVAHKL
jgi:hypothetical protein